MMPKAHGFQARRSAQRGDRKSRSACAAVSREVVFVLGGTAPLVVPAHGNVASSVRGALIRFLALRQSTNVAAFTATRVTDPISHFLIRSPTGARLSVANRQYRTLRRETKQFAGSSMADTARSRRNPKHSRRGLVWADLGLIPEVPTTAHPISPRGSRCSKTQARRVRCGIARAEGSGLPARPAEAAAGGLICPIARSRGRKHWRRSPPRPKWRARSSRRHEPTARSGSRNPLPDCRAPANRCNPVRGQRPRA